MATDLTPEEEVTPNPAEEQEKERKRLNDEAAKHRRDAKEAKKNLDAMNQQMKSITEALGVDEEHDLDTRLGELRAAAEKGSKTGLDIVTLQNRLSAAEKENKKLKGDNEVVTKERDEYSTLFRANVISSELRKGFTEIGIKPEQQEILETFVQARGHVKLNEKRKPVWVARDEDGDEIGEVPIKDGLAQFFDKNPSLAPAQTPAGGGSQGSQKPQPGRSPADTRTLLGLTKADNGITIVDPETYKKNRSSVVK